MKKELSTESILSSSEEMDDAISNESQYISSDGIDQESPIYINTNQNADRKLIIRNFTDGDALIQQSDVESNSPEDLKPLLNHNGRIIDYPTISINSKEMEDGYEEDREESDEEESGGEVIHNNNNNENGGFIQQRLGIKKVQNRRSIRDFIRRRRNNNDNIELAEIQSKKSKKRNSSSDEEYEIDHDYRPLDDDDEENENEEDDESIPINKADITAYIDDLLVKEDPTEKLDLAAYPYL